MDREAEKDGACQEDLVWRGQERGQKPTFKERLLKRDKRRFIKYIESTPTHGVVHVFTGKSKIRRLFWLVIVLGASAGCLFNITNRILFLANSPTSTTISVGREGILTFPAVTVCNLNLVRRSYLESMNLTGVFRRVFNAELTGDGSNASMCMSNVNSELQHASGSNVSIDFSKVTIEGRNIFQLFVVECFFQGVRCEDLPNDPWTPTLTRLGLCYAFNARQDEDEILTVNGTGTRHGLQLILNIQQDEYVTSSSGDAGVKLAIHPQSAPGEPDDIGIAVPPGRNAFISFKERRIDDKSSNSDCRKRSETESFNFLGSEYEYSVTACIRDCFITNIAETCGCLETSLFVSEAVGRYSFLPPCDQDHLCCLLDQYGRALGCGTTCPSSCTTTEYSHSTSYSAYPAKFLEESVISQIQYLLSFNDTVKEYFPADVQPTLDDLFRIYENVTIDKDFLEDNLLSVNIYFEDLNYEEEVTEDAYGVVALLSDIGGQLGLFLGASVISMIEFVLWIMDETKDRCCGINERKLSGWLKKSCGWLRRKNRNSRSADIELGKTDLEYGKM